ncbi:17087_t:CDS:2 [Acaulospora morrowiae]|uniref:17087_t:CDS:1 n=1 Tax=Acaulospora morrowiae TaxID=94023 RepID=A0A9N8ZDD5_9GLOM|nr:17087_t:CDS:2 [Acaulospora morrowiae]
MNQSVDGSQVTTGNSLKSGSSNPQNHDPQNSSTILNEESPSSSSSNSVASRSRTFFSRRPRPPEVLTTRMIQLDESDPEYISIKEGFKFNANSMKANILAIMKLQMPTKLERAHEKHKRKMAKRFGKREEEVTRRMHHGTKSFTGCDLIRNFETDENNDNGINGSTDSAEGSTSGSTGGNSLKTKPNYDPTFCKENCGVCGIAQCGNKRKYARTKSLFRKNRMWFAKDPSVSLGFCNYGYKGIIKGMFIVDVVNKLDDHIIITTKEKATLPRYLVIFEVPLALH